METSVPRKRRGCPHCGHSKMMEVICYRFKIGEDMGLPDHITKNRVPVFERIIGPNGEFMNDDEMKYFEDKESKEVFEKQVYFDGARHNVRSSIPSSLIDVIDIFWKCKKCLRTWSPVSGKEFADCPNCKMNSGIQIIYGLPTDIALRSIIRGELGCGGCCIDFSNPEWQCTECGFEWGKLVYDLPKE